MRWRYEKLPIALQLGHNRLHTALCMQLLPLPAEAPPAT